MQIHPNFASLQSNGSCKLVSSSDSTFDFMQYASHHMKCCFLTSLHLLQDTTIQSYYAMPRHILVLLVLNIHDNKHNIQGFYALEETGWETVQKHNFIVVNILFCVRLFNEGFYLHSRITVQIFNSEAPVILFNIIGWGESGHKYSIMSYHSLARNVWTELYINH